MKKLFALTSAVALTVLSAGTLSAQNYKIAKQGVVTDAQGAISYVVPSTSVVVTLTVEHTTLTPGPFARYAQKYLGTVAPLAEKQSYEVVDAKIGYVDTDGAQEAEKECAKCCQAESGEFSALPVSKMSADEGTLEDQARKAAAMIYKLRASRVDLITATAGENVFGAGLGDALEETTRLENECVDLFMGKSTKSKKVYSFTVVPERNLNSYVVCRFSESGGVMDASDLSASPIVLDVRSNGSAAKAVPTVQETEKNRKYERVVVAENVTCNLLDVNRKRVAEAVIPVYQMGATAVVEIK